MIEEGVGRISKMSFKKKAMIGVAFVLALVLVGLLIYVLYYQPQFCSTLECFQESSSNCQKAIYMNEDNITLWRYEILGTDRDYCKINVKLLSAKEGEVGMNKLVGYDMDCYTTGFVSYPEKDLDSCHGRLKEEMLNIILSKLHAYVVDNIDQIGKDFSQMKNSSK